MNIDSEIKIILNKLKKASTPMEVEALLNELDLKRKLKIQQEKENSYQQNSDIDKHIKEVVESASLMALPLNYEYIESNDDEEETIEVADALLASLENFGSVDIEYISRRSNLEMKEVILELQDSIYQNPLTWNETFYKGWEMSDEYLSGNINQKYKIAVAANEKYLGYFERNVAALKELMTPMLTHRDIYVTLGSPWIPPAIIDEFIKYLFVGKLQKTPHDKTLETWNANFENFETKTKLFTRYDASTGIWEIPEKNRFKKSTALIYTFDYINSFVFGTARMGCLHILEHTLNSRDIRLYDTMEDGSKKMNRGETVKVLEIQKSMIQEFQTWIWQDEQRKEELLNLYYTKYANIKKRNYNGSFLKLPGLNPDIHLFQYQKDAIARIILSPNTLLAHDVGAGKTYIMICAGMELKRLGKSNKNLYVVPNSIIGQWRDLFYSLYPKANLLVVDTNNFNAQHRESTFLDMKYRDYDAIIMSYSCFDLLPLSKEYYRKKYSEILTKLNESLAHFYSSHILDARKRRIEKKLDELALEIEEMNCFDDLDINTLFVDEAHNYKNVSIDTGTTTIRGISSQGSVKCDSMLDKVRCVQRQNNGGGMVFATGTPITNSITDIFVMQQYLQPGQLELLGLNTFDAWIGMFAKKETNFEIDIDTTTYRMATRFSKFYNIPELSAIFSSVADFYRMDNRKDLPEFNGYIESVGEGSIEFKAYLRNISVRADLVRKGAVKRKDDNMLLITMDGRKAALDMRLIDSSYPAGSDSKVTRCALNIMKIYLQNKSNLSTQLVFCDTSTPKKGFNLYDELKAKLISYGMKANLIEYVHYATTPNQRRILFEKMNRGEIAVLIGSTFKLGTGVNVQTKLIAVHHLDVPWRPSDMVQREGRILRVGNENKTVSIYRYITKGSFDAYSWQLLEIKQRFINQLLTSNVYEREGSDLDDVALSYAEVKAIAIGDPMIKRRVEIANQLNQLMILQKEYVRNLQAKQNELAFMPKKISRIKLEIEQMNDDFNYFKTIEENIKEDVALKEEGKVIYEEIMNHINRPTEYEIKEIYEFKILVPAFMHPKLRKIKEADEFGNTIERTEMNPFIYLKRSGKYMVEIRTEKSIINRIIKGISQLGDVISEKREELDAMLIQEENLKSFVDDKKDYTDRIQALQLELDEIDLKMGVKKSGED